MSSYKENIYPLRCAPVMVFILLQNPDFIGFYLTHPYGLPSLLT
jgi:hypothetical protein